MAYDKVVDSAVLDAGLTKIAEAIRLKAGNSSQLAFPDEMAESIKAIEEGIDTSDATATANDLPEGVTAYARGEKVTGTVIVYNKENEQEIDIPDPWWVASKGALRSAFGAIGGRVLMEPDASVYMDILGSALGDAIAGNVEAGKTFTSINGLKIEGNIPVITDVVLGDLYTANIVDGLFMAFHFNPEKRIIPKDFVVGLEVPGSEFGNAGVSDVLEGVTFTSVNGMNLKGTRKAGGGLPSGISALATGTVTPADDETGYLEVAHNLGVVPDFCIWCAVADVSSSVKTNAAIHGTLLNKRIKYSASSSIVYNVHYSIKGYNNSQLGGTIAQVANDNYMTAEHVWLKCSSTYPFKKGNAYRWVCGVLDGIN